MPDSRSKEGFHYKKDGHLVRGLVTEGAISPPASFANSSSGVFDLIVIGSGYAGLTASRDAAVAGLNVLLVEARDRIGGRTWTSQIDGEKYEMGGTWVHWQQGYVWRELHRYGIDKDLKITPHNNPEHSKAYSMASRNGQVYQQGLEESVGVIQRALDIFSSVESANASGSDVVPMHTHLLDSLLTEPRLVQKYDNMVVADRLRVCEQQGLLTNEELAFVTSTAELFFGSRTERCSMLGWLKWWAACNHSYKYAFDLLMAFKIKEGQSHLARKIFEEAKSTGRLSYAFDSPVKKVVDRQDRSQVVTAEGTFSARRIISTLPVNVASKVEFDPPLSALKAEAFAIGHVNQCLKVHSEIQGEDYRSWVGALASDFPQRRELVSAFGDQSLKNGNTAVVAFGIDFDPKIAPSKDPTRIARAFGQFEPELAERYISSTWTEWGDDPYAKGAWFMPSPGYLTRFHRELQARSGNILWASADWADGWNSFIDGAIEQGTKAAFIVVDEWRKEAIKAKL